MALFPRYLTGGLRRAYTRGAENIRSAPIATRVLGAIGILAVLVAIAFAVVLLAMSNLRSSTDEQVQANRVTASTLRLERVVDELEESLRSFVLTRNDRIRQSWNAGRGPSSPRRPPSWRPRRRAARPERSSSLDDRAHPRLRDRLRQSADRDRARQPGGGALPGRVAGRADAHRRDPARAGDRCSPARTDSPRPAPRTRATRQTAPCWSASPRSPPPASCCCSSWAISSGRSHIRSATSRPARRGSPRATSRSASRRTARPRSGS